MTRSKFKPTYFSKHILRIRKQQKKGVFKSDFKIWDRSSNIPVEFLGQSVSVSSGRKKDEIPFYLMEEMLGHKFGEFVMTKKTGAEIHRNNRLLRKKRNKYNQLLMQKRKRKNKKLFVKKKKK